MVNTEQVELIMLEPVADQSNLCKEVFEERASVAVVHFGDVFRGSRGHNGAAIFATFWTHINEVVAHLQHVEVVFNDHHSVALIHQFVEDVDEQLDVLKVKDQWWARRGCRGCCPFQREPIPRPT